MTKAPVFFISHGAPTFALEPGTLGPRLNVLGKALSKAAAVLVVSPHWQTRDVRVMTTPTPETIHDFGGFPAALYELQYPAQGHPVLAAEAGRLLAKAGFAASFDDRRGLDHGAWVPLFHLLPAADIPVFQVSMPDQLDTAGAVTLGQALAPLRDQGVAIVCSGSMTHNLHEFRQGDVGEAAYVQEFRNWVRQAVVADAVERAVAYRQYAPHAARAHPTEEHFLPLLVALGARADGETAQVIEADTTYGVISMESYMWGDNERVRHE
ncbi:MAG TPA: class III extradiol ring-cleavage dioxygenase [Patescibacteria group bacterium]|nr:class III extradiol ring-cleavage dioxygenase [Patescibacteria group bacterium]